MDQEEEEEAALLAYEKYTKTIPTLPIAKGWITDQLVKYKGTWLTPHAGLKGVMLSEQLFNPNSNDVILATFPKSGTTWLKALIFSILNRKLSSLPQHPLLTTCPHDCVPFLEALFADGETHHHTINDRPSPCILATHVPYPLLSQILGNAEASPKNKIVYVARNPKDVLVSSWEYMRKLRSEPELPPLTIEEAYEMFCEGVAHFGPYWDHVKGFYSAALLHGESVLFLTYEDMKAEPCICVRRMADFLGQGFSEEEEKEGKVEEIVKLCSFESLSNLEVNKSGSSRFSKEFMVPNSYFFREGEVGGWRKYLSVKMAEHLDEITASEFQGLGFKTF